jgi:hypothetical protein
MVFFDSPFCLSPFCPPTEDQTLRYFIPHLFTSFYSTKYLQVLTLEISAIFDLSFIPGRERAKASELVNMRKRGFGWCELRIVSIPNSSIIFICVVVSIYLVLPLVIKWRRELALTWYPLLQRVKLSGLTKLIRTVLFSIFFILLQFTMQHFQVGLV